MSDSSKKNAKLQLDSSLIESAENYLEQLPKTLAEVIERWALIGKVVEEQLTEQELLLLQLRNANVKLSLSSDD